MEGVDSHAGEASAPNVENDVMTETEKLMNMHAAAKPVMSGACRALRKQYGMEDGDSALVNTEELRSRNITAPGLHFVHLPKTGGSSVNQLLLGSAVDPRWDPMLHPHMNPNETQTLYRGHYLPHGKCGKYTSFNDKCKVNMGCHCFIWHVPPRYVSASRISLDQPMWTIVRHPLDRALSEYKMRNAHLAHNVNPNVWLTTRLLDTNRDAHVSDCHSVPQYEYVWDAQYRKVIDYVLAHEDGDVIDSVSALYEALNLHANMTERPSKITYHKAGQFANLSRYSISKHTRDLLAAYYWKDYCLFGYDTSVEPPPPLAAEEGGWGEPDLASPDGQDPDGNYSVLFDAVHLAESRRPREYVNPNPDCGVADEFLAANPRLLREKGDPWNLPPLAPASALRVRPLSLNTVGRLADQGRGCLVLLLVAVCCVFWRLRTTKAS